MSGYFDLYPDYDPLLQPSANHAVPTSTAAPPAEGLSIRERHEVIALDMDLLLRDARTDIEQKRKGLAEAIATSVDIEHSAAKLTRDASRARRHRIVGRLPPHPRPLGAGMG